MSRHVLSGISGIVFAYITYKIVPGVFLSCLDLIFKNRRSNTQFDQGFITTVKPLCFDQYSGDSDWRETDNAVCKPTLLNCFLNFLKLYVRYLPSILRSTVYWVLRIIVHTFSYTAHTPQIRNIYHGVKGSV